MPEEEYDPVRLNQETNQGTEITEERMAGKGTEIFLATFGTLLFLLDVTSSIYYAVFLFCYADDRVVQMYGFKYNTGGGLIIAIALVSNLIINIVITLDRFKFHTMDWLEIVLRVLLCFIPYFYVIEAMYIHLSGALKRNLNERKIELVGVTRVLQGLGEGIPQVIFQSFVVTREVLRRGETETAYPTWVPVTSLIFSLINATFTYTFYLTGKYYSEIGVGPKWWQQCTIAFTALLLLGGRSLAVGLMGAAWDMLWVAVLGLITIFLLMLVYWTYRVRKRAGSPFHSLKTRISLSLIEMLGVAVPLRWTAIVSLPYLGLSAAFVGQRHEDPIDWVLFSVPLCAQLIGLLLILPCRDVYWSAYQGFLHFVLPPKQEILYPVVT